LRQPAPTIALDLRQPHDTHSSTGAVSVTSGDTYNVTGTAPVGSDPFGVAMDLTWGVNRGDNSLSVFADNFGP